jgi:hypothetical protein
MVVQDIGGFSLEEQNGLAFLFVFNAGSLDTGEPIGNSPGCQKISGLGTPTSLDLHRNEALDYRLIATNALYLAGPIDLHGIAHVA